MAILNGAPYSYVMASLTTFERRFAFNSIVTGFILIADDVAGLIFRPFMGYFAHRIHRPRMLGMAQLISATGCVVATLPYWIYGPGVHLLGATVDNPTGVNKTGEFCSVNSLSDNTCNDSTGINTSIIPVLCLVSSTFLIGLSSACYWTIGIPFVDDNIEKKNSPMAMSFLTCFRLFGPTTSFMLSSLVLRYYENPLIDPGIKDLKDPRWVGAWWIGFLVLAIALIITSIPMFLFPADLKQQKQVKDSVHNNDKQLSTLESNKIKEKVNQLGVVKRVTNLLINPIYLCYVLGTCARLFGVLGYITFKSKYLESQYKKSASTANFVSGIVGILPSGAGILLGGVILTCFQPGPRILTIFVMVVEMLGPIGILAGFFLGCPTSQFASLPINNLGMDVQSQCNSNCGCTEQLFHPICGPDNITNYYSPCYAGCAPESLIKPESGPNQYSMCSCLEGGSATDGYCNNQCGNNFEIFVTLTSIGGLIGQLSRTGNAIISLRIVETFDKSLAIGIAGSMYSLLAFIPYPLVFGAILNSACMVWEKNCGKTGNCLVYDSDKFRNRFLGITLAMILLGSVFDILVVILSSRIKNLYDDNDNEDCDTNSKSKKTNNNNN
ncbi:solute carrier organic anion transporter family member 2A1-like [Oppia nitens]|uniref:solute carrier organic anion transporter family member 2A1-like n=1 Tax=Oppia nitens TaxID=1686743 RepID=UPI0023DA5F70|nr:solute carrier organic anion transporter family member 2A1-like [Oppia nitens]